MLNKRQTNIIDLLNDYGKWITGKEIAKVLNVSDRTIRSDIENINNYYDCILIQANKRLGYRLDETLLHKQDIETKDIIHKLPKNVVYILFKNFCLKVMKLI